MDLSGIIDEIASQADDFLASAANRKEARAGIVELVNTDHPRLSPVDRKKITEGVMAILEQEGFFEAAGRWGGAGEEVEDGK
jgi:hypothetical protein